MTDAQEKAKKEKTVGKTATEEKKKTKTNSSLKKENEKEVKSIFFEKYEDSVSVQEQSHWDEKAHLSRRSESIDDILEHYAQQQQKRYEFKELWKKRFVFFFVGLASIIILGSAILIIFALKNLKENYIAFLTCVIGGLFSCFSSIVTILLIIVKYVFPTNEETTFNELVSIIVQNDTMRLKDISNNDEK